MPLREASEGGADVGRCQIGQRFVADFDKHRLEYIAELIDGLRCLAIHAVREPVVDRDLERASPRRAHRLLELIVQNLELVLDLLLRLPGDNFADALAVGAEPKPDRTYVPSAIGNPVDAVIAPASPCYRSERRSPL